MDDFLPRDCELKGIGIFSGCCGGFAASSAVFGKMDFLADTDDNRACGKSAIGWYCDLVGCNFSANNVNIPAR